MTTRRVDIAGQRFERLVVLGSSRLRMDATPYGDAFATAGMKGLSVDKA
jgi:hypothetical protein